MSIEVVGGLEGEKGSDSHHHGAQHRVPNIEVIMGETRAALSQDGIVGVLGCEFGLNATEAGTLFHTLKDKVNTVTVLTFHGFEERQNDLFLANLLFCPLEWDLMVTGIGFDPGLVSLGSFHEDFFGNAGDTENLTEEVDDVFRAREHGEIPVDDDSVKAMVNEDDHGGKEFDKSIHRRSSLMIFLDKDNHHLDRRWMQQKNHGRTARMVFWSYP